MRKVGGSLSKYNIINEVFDTIGEIAKKSDFISAGLKDQDIYAFCKQGYLERVKKGYYKLATSDEPKEELILSKLMTHGVVCVESALFYYGYSDFAPREWSIAVPVAGGSGHCQHVGRHFRRRRGYGAGGAECHTGADGEESVNPSGRQGCRPDFLIEKCR